ncbi:hypothetical protein [Gordonia sihwensis]|uniref:hypothetical protein n=1 Tax=Gordonia sihwensis TaxID=173559 RepID=UPI0005EDAE7A|nr:hypothetical protein [Gordonia sihwensis]KJR06060.1 hypothetical protein UG54_14735 [Gordonia sihwensis]
MTTLSGSPLYFMKGFDEYVSSHAAHDQDRPGGPSARVEHMSTVGDCAPLTFAGDVRRTALSYGKGDLEVDAYSYVLSHSHEELDPANDDLGVIAHGLAREWVIEAFPGRQAKIVTQRDNGRWEEVDGQRTWVEGHWHSHIIVANVAEQEVLLRWTDAKGVEKAKHYAAGRAIDGDLKNIFRLRHITDAVVQREWQYDNKAYVEECRRFNEGAATKMDFAERAERGYSSYDEVRLKLRTAAAQATDWTDYVTRCQAAAVDVKTRGKAGVSYAWVGDDGLERKARARGKTGIGPEFTRAEIEKRCEQNAVVLERGGELEIPPQELVVPSTTVAPDRPRPQYQTADGKPPWENERALAEYEARVQATGGTYEGLAERALVTGDPVEGVALVREDEAVVATVDAGDGPAVFDVDAALAGRVAEIEAAQAALAEREQAFEANRVKTVAAVNAAIDEADAKFTQADEALASAQADRAAAAGARQAGYEAGLDEGRAAWEQTNGPSYREKVRAEAVEAWETTTAPALRAELRAEIRTEVQAAMQADRDAAARDRDEAKQARDEAERRLAEIPDYDADAAIQDMQAARYEAGWVVKTPRRRSDGTVQRDADNKVVWEPANFALDREAERIYNNRKGQGAQDQTVGEAARAEKDEQAGGRAQWTQASAAKEQSKTSYLGED